MPGGREVSEDIPGERNDGRGDTQLSKVVRLSIQNNNSITDSGSSTVELQDFTDDPAAFSSALDVARNADTENGWSVSPQLLRELFCKTLMFFKNCDIYIAELIDTISHCC